MTVFLRNRLRTLPIAKASALSQLDVNEAATYFMPTTTRIPN